MASKVSQVKKYVLSLLQDYRIKKHPRVLFLLVIGNWSLVIGFNPDDGIGFKRPCR